MKGIVKEALEFDGKKSYVDFGAAFEKDVLAAGSEEWTITLWIKPISLVSNASNHGTMNCFLAKASDPSNDNLEFGVQTNNDLHLYIDAQPKDSQMDFGEGELKKGKWHFVGVSYDTKGSVDVWLDKNHYPEPNSWKGSRMDAAGGSPFTIGATIHIDTYLHGAVDEVAVYERALSEKEIIKNRQAALAVASTGKLTITWGQIKASK